MALLESLNTMLTEALGPAGPLIAVAGLAALMILSVVPFVLKDKGDPMDKLNKLQQSNNPEVKAALRDGAKSATLNKYAQFLEPQDAEKMDAMRMTMLQAGYRSREAVRIFHMAQMILGLGGLAFGLIWFTLFKSGPDSTTQQMMQWIIIPGGIGYYAPKYWITRRVETRKEEITMGFPDALDMMLVCVEAGQSMDQSLVRVAREIRPSYPALADEFEIVTHEMKAGKDKSQVLDDMSERCGVQDVSSFVTVLNQAQSFGTSISDALRVYAGEMRDKRVMRAEEKANKLPTKMTLTTMMLTVPPLLIILVGPSAVGIAELGNTGN